MLQLIWLQETNKVTLRGEHRKKSSAFPSPRGKGCYRTCPAILSFFVQRRSRHTCWQQGAWSDTRMCFTHVLSHKFYGRISGKKTRRPWWVMTDCPHDSPPAAKADKDALVVQDLDSTIAITRSRNNCPTDSGKLQREPGDNRKADTQETINLIIL